MANQFDAAIDNLSKRGWSEDDIANTISQVNQQTDTMLQQGKTEAEVASFLSKIVIEDQRSNRRDKFNLFAPAKQPVKIPDVPEPTMMQNIASGPVGGAIEAIGSAPLAAMKLVTERPQALLPVVGGATEALMGNKQYQSGAGIGNPLPPIVTEALGEVLEYIKSGRKGFTVPGTNIEITGQTIGKLIEDAMNTYIPGRPTGRFTRPSEIVPAVKNLPSDIGKSLTTIEGGNIANAIYPKTNIQPPISAPGRVPIRPESPITGGEIQGSPLGPTVSQSSIVGQTSTPSKMGGTNLPALITDPQFLDEVKQVRRVGIANGDVELINYTSKILEENNVTDYVPRGANVTRQLSQPTPEVTINIAKEARRFGEETNDPVLVERANRAINDVGIVKPIEVGEAKRLIDTEQPKPDIVKESIETAADANIVAVSHPDPIAFKPILDDVTAEPTITMRKAASNPKTAFSDGKTNFNDTQALDNVDVPKETPSEIVAGTRLIDAALVNQVDGLSSMTDNPAKYFSDEVKNKNRNPDGSLPPPMQGEMVTSNPPPAVPPLQIQLMRRWLPFYRIADKIEADTKIPVMTELYVKGRIASNQDIEFKLEKQAQLDKIFGDYTSPRQKYREGNDRMSEAMENVLDYDSKTDEITWKDSSGVGHTGNVAQAARDLGIPVKEVEIVGKVREFFTDSFTDTGLEFDKFAMFYLPRRWRSNPEERFKYMSQFREDQQPFFSYRKAGGNQPRELETNLYNLANIYVNEWAKTKYLMPWKKEVADPILDKIVKYPQGASSVPLAYVGHYVEDIMGIPRTGAVEFNYTVGNWIERVGQKHPELAETLYTWLSRDRPGEILGSKLLKLQYQGALGFRIWPAIRNATQRGFAIPLMPGGVKDLTYGRAKMLTKDGHDILQLSGVYGYLGDLVDRHAVANSRWYHPLTTYQSIENANRGSIYLSQYYHLMEDLKNGMTVGRIADKYKFHLFPESLQNHWKELIKNKQYGDIREVGLINNAVHSIADWTQLITQFPYDKGGGAEITKTGPIVKQAAAFNSWNLFTADYMTNLLADAARKSRPKYIDGVKVSSGSYKDLANVAKMFAIFMVADRLSDHFFGASIGSTPIANLPTKLFESPTMTLAKSAQQVVAGETDKLMSNIILGRENEYAAMEAKEGWRKLKSTLPVFIPGGLLMRDISRAIQSGDPTRAIIPKPKEQKKPPSDISAE